MYLKIEFESDIPIYVQIRNQIIEGIASGKLKEGDELPSIRQLASDFGINLHTVNKAYDMLKNDGFLAVHRRKGVVISNNAVADDKFIEVFKSQVGPFLAEALCRGMTQKQIIELCSKILGGYKGDE